MAAAKTGSLADIDFDRLANELLSDKISDPDKAQRMADEQARRTVIRKYRLSPRWKQADDLGLTITYSRNHVDVAGGPDIGASMQALNDCLHSEDGPFLFKGCYPTELRRSQ